MDEERQPLLQLTSITSGERSRRWGKVCLLVVVFLEAVSINGLDSRVRSDVTYAFRLDMDRLTSFFCIGAVFIYILPMAIGLYADVVVGKYQALFFGFVLKVTGSLIGFGVVLKLEASGGDPGLNTMTKVLAALYIISVVLIAVGASAQLILIVTFGSKQFSCATQSSMVRWGLAVIMLGCFTEYFIAHYHNYSSYIRPDLVKRYWQTIKRAVVLGLDGVSLAIFLLGKPSYLMPSPEEGRKSFKRILRIVRARFCKSSPRWSLENNESVQLVNNPEETTRMKKVERLRFRNGVFIIPLMSVISVSMMMMYGLDHIAVYNLEYFNKYSYWFSLLRNARFLVFVPLAPVTELIMRSCGHRLLQNGLVYSLMVMGVGLLSTILSLITAGVVAAAAPNHDFAAVSILWMLPQYILNGVAMFMIYHGVIMFCLSQSPPGISTFLFSVTACLCLLFLPFGVLIVILIDLRSLIPFTHVICFVLAAITLAVSLVIYLPVCMWYVQADKAIDSYLAEGDDATGQEDE